MSIRKFPSFPSRAFPSEDGRDFPTFGKESSTPVPDPSFSNVELLLHFEGADQDTTCLDFSVNSFVPTFAGNAQIDTAISKFGGSSLLVDGIGDVIKFQDRPGFSFGDGDFTIDIQVYPTTVGTKQIPISKYSNTAGLAEWFLIHQSSTSRWEFLAYYGTGANSVFSFGGSWALTQNTWEQVAVERHGDTWRIYSDGFVVASHEEVRSLADLVQSLWIGGRNHSVPSYWHGNIDETRITKGTARYQGTHVIQTEPWPNL